jgi:hypothetical protein
LLLSDKLQFVAASDKLKFYLTSSANSDGPEMAAPNAVAMKISAFLRGSSHLTTSIFVTGWISHAVARQLFGPCGAVFSDSLR